MMRWSLTDLSILLCNLSPSRLTHPSLFILFISDHLLYNFYLSLILLEYLFFLSFLPRLHDLLGPLILRSLIKPLLWPMSLILVVLIFLVTQIHHHPIPTEFQLRRLVVQLLLLLLLLGGRIDPIYLTCGSCAWVFFRRYWLSFL
jgi:hypothetical protein